MAKIQDDDNTITQIVRFDAEPSKQDSLIAAIVGEVERWVSQRPGFVSSTFHASFDGKNVVNYAQWKDEAESLQKRIREVDPSLKIQCRVVRSLS